MSKPKPSMIYAILAGFAPCGILVGFDVSGWVGIFALLAWVGLFSGLRGVAHSALVTWLELLAVFITGIGSIALWDVISTTESSSALFLATDVTKYQLTAVPLTLILYSFGSSLSRFVLGSARGRVAGSSVVWIGIRFLTQTKGRSLSTVSTLALVGVGLGNMLIFGALGILSGLEADLQSKLIGSEGHLGLWSADRAGMQISPAVLGELNQDDAVKAVVSTIEDTVVLGTSIGTRPAKMFGVSEASTPEVFEVLEALQISDLESGDGVSESRESAVPDAQKHFFAPPKPVPSIFVSDSMAEQLDLRIGQTVTVTSPSVERLTPLGAFPVNQSFRVADIFESQLANYDHHYVFVGKDAARKFLGLGQDRITHIRVRLLERYADDAERLAQKFGQRLNGSQKWDFDTWQSRNASLLGALLVERAVFWVVMVLIMLVSSFAVVSTLFMSASARTEDIAILKTMGMPKSQMALVFLVQALGIGLVGSVIGVFIGALLLLALQVIGFPIPQDVYNLEQLPITIPWLYTPAIIGMTLVLIWDFAVLPAMKSAELRPVEGLKGA